MVTYKLKKVVERDERLMRLKSVIAVFSIAALIIIIATEYTADIDKSFSVEAYYRGNISSDTIDPKTLYEQYTAAALDNETLCNTQTWTGKARRTSSDAIWVAETSEDITDDYIKECLQDGYLAPFKEGDLILAPGAFTFTNTNTDSSGATIDIKGTCGKYTFVFENVSCWWCHIGKEWTGKHSIRIGCGTGLFEKVSAGTVIGEAKASTKLYIYKESDGVDEELEDPSTYFIGN